MERIEINFLLGGPGREEGNRSFGLPLETMLLRMRIDLLSAARHRVYKIIWNIADFEQSPSRVELDLVAKSAPDVGELVANDLLRRHLFGENGAGLEARSEEGRVGKGGGRRCRYGW